MKRDFLEELGLEKEVIDKIMDENGKDINEAKGKNNDEKVKELEAERDKLNQALSERDDQLAELKKSAEGNEELKSKIDELTSQNKEQLEQHQNEIKAIRKANAIESALKDANVHDVRAAMPYIDVDKVSLDDNGIIGLSEQIETLQNDENKKFLFKDTNVSIKGAKPGEAGDKDDGADLSEIDKRIAKYKK